jgi:hypothetical protein
MFFRHCLFELELCTNCSYILLDTCTSLVLAIGSAIQGVCGLYCMEENTSPWLTFTHVCIEAQVHSFTRAYTYSKAQMPQILLHNCGGIPCGDRYVHHGLARAYTDRKENEIFIYKEIKMGSVATCKVIYEEELPNICGNAQIFSHI